MIKTSESQYLKGGSAIATSGSSLLLSSSKYLNHSRLRDVLAQECLRKSGREFPLAYLVPDAMQAFEELKNYPRIFELLAAERVRHPEFAEWLDARYVSRFSAASTQGFAPGTLGATFHDFIVRTGYQVDFLFTDAPRNDYEYMMKRLAQNHDVEHLVTGFYPDPCGENALMTCNNTTWMRYFDTEFAGEMCRFGVYLTMVNTIRAGMHYPRVLPIFYEAIRLGTTMGQQLQRPLFMMKWEDHFHRTVPEIRAALGIDVKCPEDSWAWTEEAWMEPA